MKKIEELEDDCDVKNTRAESCLDHVFDRITKVSQLYEDHEITKQQHEILCDSYEHAQVYSQKFGYTFNLTNSQDFCTKYYIRFIVQ